MIGQELDRDREEQGRDKRIAVRHCDAEGEPGGKPGDPGGVRDHDDAAAAGHDLLDVAEGLFKEIVVRRQHDDRNVLVNEGDRPMLHLARGIALGVDVGDLLQL